MKRVTLLALLAGVAGGWAAARAAPADTCCGTHGVSKLGPRDIEATLPANEAGSRRDAADQPPNGSDPQPDFALPAADSFRSRIWARDGTAVSRYRETLSGVKQRLAKLDGDN